VNGDGAQSPPAAEVAAAQSVLGDQRERATGLLHPQPVAGWAHLPAARPAVLRHRRQFRPGDRRHLCGSPGVEDDSDRLHLIDDPDAVADLHQQAWT
jgi:hypothetical protein